MNFSGEPFDNNYKTILFKSVQGDVIKEATLPTNAALHDLWVCVGGKNATRGNVDLVFRGEVLLDEWLTVEEVFGKYGKPIVFVVKKDKEQIRSVERPRIVSPRVEQQQQPPPQIEEQGRCRICYSTESTREDPLFRPCLCRGTVGLVHVSCLNAWRERPENPDAYFRCVNCGYQYRIARARFAQLLTSAEYANIGTVVMMVMMVLLGSVLTWAVIPRVITDWFFEYVEWTPPDEDYPPVRYLLFAISCIGLTGFFFHLAEMWAFVRDHGTMESVFAIGVGLTANGKRGIRIFAFCGLAVAYRMLYVACDRLVRRVFTAFGERVLAVTE